MLIGICGGICAGKHSVANYLVERHDFKRVHLNRTVGTPLVEKSTSESHVPNQSYVEGSASSNDQSFATVESLVEYITKQWKQRWVTTDIWDKSTLEALLRRPFFILISVDAPVSVRWKRFRDRCELNRQSPPLLEEFVLRNDDHLYNQTSGLSDLISRAELRLINPTTSLQTLHRALEKLDLSNEDRLRPSWDQYFMQLALFAAKRSNCMKRRIGCVLVQDKRVISTGYNGTPKSLTNCNAGGCPRCNDGQKAGVALSTCLCIHAEENALLEAGRERIREGSILYCDTCPCLTCSVKITQVGISEVVYSLSYSVDHETAAIFSRGGVKLRRFSPPQKGLIHLNQMADDEASLENNS